MKIRIILVLVFLQCCLMACYKEQPKPPEPPPAPTKYPTNLEVLWEAFWRHSDSIGDYVWDYEVANEQYLLLANKYDRENDRPRGIGVYNMQTGERHSAWTSDPGGIFGISEYENINDCKVAGKNKDVILIYSKFDLFGYNLHSGQRMWKVSIPANTYGQTKISVKGDNAFISYGPSATWSRLAIIDVYSGTKRDILQLEKEDNFEFEISPPSAYVAGNGDTLLFFTTDALNFETLQDRRYTYCYNLTKRQMLWINKPLATEERCMGVSSSQPPPYIIENDKLIITGRKMIWCLNQHTGKLIWEKDEMWSTFAPPLYHDGKIYIRSGNPCILLCLDAQTGRTIWQNTTLNPLPQPDGNMAIYKDRLYFSAKGYNVTSHLACIDIHTGQELWRDRGPYGNIAFGVLIDQNTGYLYCYTGWSTLCVDLNKTPK